MVSKTRSGFAKRLKEACDNSPSIPPEYHGRQRMLAESMGVTAEAVRKWMEGLARPKVDKIERLAKLLSVDSAWLALGVKPEFDTPGRRKEFRAHLDGLVYIAFGAFIRGGYACAFPEKEEGGLHFYAIRSGVQMAVHIAEMLTDDGQRFTVKLPSSIANLKPFVVLDRGACEYTVLDFSAVNEHPRLMRDAGLYYEVAVRKDGSDYKTNRHVWKRVTFD